MSSLEKSNEEMKKIWDMIKDRIPNERLWKYAERHKRFSFSNWILDEIFRRGK